MHPTDLQHEQNKHSSDAESAQDRSEEASDATRTEGPEREGMAPEPQGTTRRCRDPEGRQEYIELVDPCPECGKRVTR